MLGFLRYRMTDWEGNKLNQESQEWAGWAAGHGVGGLRAGSFALSHPRKELYGGPLVHHRCHLATTDPPTLTYRKAGGDITPLLMSLYDRSGFFFFFLVLLLLLFPKTLRRVVEP